MSLLTDKYGLTVRGSFAECAILETLIRAILNHDSAAACMVTERHRILTTALARGGRPAAHEWLDEARSGVQASLKGLSLEGLGLSQGDAAIATRLVGYLPTGGQMAARRQWAGTTPQERRATRRRSLLDAGISALGAIDGSALTIRTVCRSSGVSERNFYEEFSDRDDFVRAVYQDVLESVMRVVTEFAAEGDDVETRAVETFIGATVDNPVYGRILMVAPFTEPTLASAGFAGSLAFASLAEQALTDIDDPGRRRFLSVSLVGAASGAIIDYLRGDLAISRDELIDYISRMSRQVSAIFG